jgi:hypothetical protein
MFPEGFGVSFGVYFAVGIMGQGRLYRSIFLQVLLIATAIQGPTPDAYDLASIKPLWLICHLLAQPDKISDDDGMPDEVCGPMRAEVDVVACQNAEHADAGVPGSFVTERWHVARSVGATGASAARGKTVGDDGLIHMLCRLVC